MELLDDSYRVDFDKYQRSISDDAWARMLEQFHIPWRPGFTWNHETRCWDRAPWGAGSSILRQFLDVLTCQCRELYDALIDLQRMRTVYDAEKDNLDALGRIVGAQRGRPLLDYGEWFHVDDERTVDISPAWVEGAANTAMEDRTDTEFRMYIIAKAARNHTLYASAPEVLSMAKTLLGMDVSFFKAAPMTVAAIAYGADHNQRYILTVPENNDQYDGFWVLPYPAGLSVTGVVTQ